MTEKVRIVSVDADNLEEEGFFCYKSKPKSEGYQKKAQWLNQCFAEDLRIQILYEGQRSVAFVEYGPGEHTWRAVEAPDYLVIHCLWVVGKGKGKGYASRLLDLVAEEAKAEGKAGVAMVCSEGNWLAAPPIFLKNGYQVVDEAPPSFSLLALPFGDQPLPRFPTDWEARAQAFGPGATIVYADQCPYMPDAVQDALDVFAARDIPTRVVHLESSAAAREQSPSPYGVFGITLNGELLFYHYLGKREIRLIDEKLAGTS